MVSMNLNHLLSLLPQRLRENCLVSFKGVSQNSRLGHEMLDIDCSGMTLDSREVVENDIFLAVNGHQLDGRDYMKSAIDNGASVVIYELHSLSAQQSASVNKAECLCIGVTNLNEHASLIASCFYGNPTEEIQVYGITGTNGKTSCCYLLAQAFNHLGYKTAFMGTIGVGHPNDLELSTHTTLDAVSLQRYLAHLRATGFTHACIEVSSHALEQFRVASVNFYAVLYTNLSQDHLDYHQTMEAYAQAKKRLFVDFDSTLAIININDAFGKAVLAEVNAEFIVSYGNEESGADVVAEDVKATQDGLAMLMVTESLEFGVESPLLGLVNVPNITLVVSTLLALGVDVSKIDSVVRQCSAAPGRMELYDALKLPMVVVDYAHSPDALKLALLSCRAHCVQQLWVVFGCGGDRDKEKRPLMGQVAEKHADRLVVCSDNPRSESPDDIIAEILLGINTCDRCTVIENRSTAIAYAIKHASENDLILVAGKGHETGQIIGDHTFPYSDRDWVKECLEVAA